MTYRHAAKLALADGRPDVALVWATLACQWPAAPDSVTDEEYRRAIATPAEQPEERAI